MSEVVNGMLSIALGALMLLVAAGLFGGCCIFKKKEVSSQPGAGAPPIGGSGSISTGAVGH